jgi:hypothetical protein
VGRVNLKRMNRKTRFFLVLLLAWLIVGGALLLRKSHEHPPVTVTVRIAVTPPEQSGFVAGEANSARFKYMIGKVAGVQPVLAQKLSVKPLGNSPFLEGKVGVSTKDEAERYVAGFIANLQLVCGGQATVALAEQSIH